MPFWCFFMNNFKVVSLNFPKIMNWRIFHSHSLNLANRNNFKFLLFLGNGPPPPPLPPPLKDHGHRGKQKLRESLSYDPENYSTDHYQKQSNIEVIEEHALRPSELIRGNQNRSMSMISGKKKLKKINEKQ